MNKKLIDTLLLLTHQLIVAPDTCEYSMNMVLALVRDSYGKDSETNYGAILYFTMLQFVKEDQPKFIEFCKPFVTKDDLILLELLAGTIDPMKLSQLIGNNHINHYLKHINEATSVFFYDEDLYDVVYIPAYLIHNEVRYVHVRGEEAAGLVVTFVSLDHANGFCYDYDVAYEHAKDFYAYNKAGNTPIAPSLEQFFIKPILIKKGEAERMDIFQKEATPDKSKLN